MKIMMGVGIFLLIVTIIEGGYFVLRNLKGAEKKVVRKRLKTLSSSGWEHENSDIVRKRSLSHNPWLNRLLLRFQRAEKMNRLLEQAGMRRPLGFFILLSILLAAAGYLGTSWNILSHTVSVLVGASLGIIPFLYIYSMKRRRMQKFQAQLPEALDLVARALRAGHAFTGGIKLVADEMSDPIGTEFGQTLDEINFGVGVPEALKNLSDRVDCTDLRFFVLSVIIQRETGGNLAEILEKISYLIRERFKLFGRIRVLSAQGRISAAILIVLPFFVAFGLSLINPKYIQILNTDPIGKIMIAVAVILMIMGVFVMKKMIAIKV